MEKELKTDIKTPSLKQRKANKLRFVKELHQKMIF